MNEHQPTRRVDDNFIGRFVRLWPMVFGILGVLYALTTNYNTVKSNSEGISKLNNVTDGLAGRIGAIEKDLAVKNSQFTVILNRTDRIEDKLDRLISKEIRSR